VSIQKIRTGNETAQYIGDPEIKKFYKYDYYVQINLSTVNGHSLRQSLTMGKSPDKGKKDSKSKQKGESRWKKHLHCGGESAQATA
jgi:hypothetical protein